MSQAIRPKPRLTSAFQRLMSVHWWMALCYLILFIGGTGMSQLPREVTFRGMLYDFHKSIGILSIALLTWRIFVLLQVWWKKYSKRWPKFTPKWWQTFALHTALYGFMWAVPIAGVLLSNSFKANNVKFFGLVLPDIFPQDKAMIDVGRNLHFWLAYTFLGFVILHTIAQWKVVRANWRRFQNFTAQLKQQQRS
ncbi:cytochrome b [filamentous cyanobacterium LEGE 11480]|uniref:Cytochrome b n=2 Tax=Romeriopsis TaxID=2992131 RepID=A0A928Z361_9CYAN|nr:cytochrome b [Romeriopsis navalis LEGE 11480]